MKIKHLLIPRLIFTFLLILEIMIIFRYLNFYQTTPVFRISSELLLLVVIHIFLLANALKNLYTEDFIFKSFLFSKIIRTNSINEYYFFLGMLAILSVVLFIVFLLPKTLNGTGVTLNDLLKFFRI